MKKIEEKEAKNEQKTTEVKKIEEPKKTSEAPKIAEVKKPEVKEIKKEDKPKVEEVKKVDDVKKVEDKTKPVDPKKPDTKAKEEPKKEEIQKYQTKSIAQVDQKKDDKKPATNVKTLVLKQVNMNGEKKKEEVKPIEAPKSEIKVEKQVAKVNSTEPKVEKEGKCDLGAFDKKEDKKEEVKKDEKKDAKKEEEGSCSMS